MARLSNKEFARLFKKYRLRSEIDTLSEFADLLAEEGYIYDTSIFTHWQKGTRIPHERKIFLAILRIFIKKGGISTVEEANNLLASLGHRDITHDEHLLLPSTILKQAPFLAPEEIEYFVGRNKAAQHIIWHILKKHSVFMYGQPGSGKTALAIHIAHLMRHKFSDGVIWYRCDVKHMEDIFLDIGKVYGYDLSKEVQLEQKARCIRKLLSTKDVLLILDNVDSFDSLKMFFDSGTAPCAILLTSRIGPPLLFNNPGRVRLNGFNLTEVETYARKILGNAFLLTNSTTINELGKKVEYSPLILSVLFRQIENKPDMLSQFMQKIDKFPFETIYDNKTIEYSLDFSLKNLSALEKDTFVALGIFPGGDFSVQAVAYVQALSMPDAVKVLRQLQKRSLIEYSVQDRYRLHPLVKLYLQKKIQEEILVRKLAEYYINFLSHFYIGNESFYPDIEIEIDNMKGIVDKCNRFGLYTHINQIWRYMGVFYWDTGRWIELDQYGTILSKINKGQQKLYQNITLEHISKPFQTNES